MVSKIFRILPVFSLLIAVGCGGGGGDGGGGGIDVGTLGVERSFLCSCSGTCDVPSFSIRILSDQESLIWTDASGGNEKTFVRRGEEPGFIVNFASGSESLDLNKGVVDDPSVRSGSAEYRGDRYTCNLR